MIANLEFGNAGANLFDDAATLMPEDDRVLLPTEHFDDGGIHCHIAGDHVLVGMAHATGDKSNEDLIGLRVVELNLFDLVLGMRAIQDRGSCPPRNSFSGAQGWPVSAALAI